MKKIRVFLVHAVQDKPTVRDLYARLKSEAWIDPWFDEENLLPGQNWDLEIQKALRGIDAIIICLSKLSIAKEGYIQKEIKRALDICDEKPDGTIYIIPLRLDDCEIPFRLQKFHWVDYFNKNYDQKLLGALKSRAETLGIETGSSETVVAVKPIEPEKQTPGGHSIYTFAGIDFVKVPAGDFFMGADDIKYSSPQHLVYQLDYDYYIGRFAITNQDYSKFLREQGKPVILKPEKLKHPLVNISWYNAWEYIEWLNKNKLPKGLIFYLPSEAEWEKAARGVEGNIYPWGNTFDKNRCNSLESGNKGTTTVGRYSPQGDSPFGCADMSGNIWEWTRSLYEFKYPYDPNDERECCETMINSMARVLRGGSSSGGIRGLHCAYRHKINAFGHGDHIGFRVAICPVSRVR
ncbi:MAG: SUMF1/EgtB/PvdO family nonheme iron enzyme [Anaerolineales bacterium]|nr:SUMF1/EgtB/PvdO family nonheme iron enzyme [Anaerolineales bacterium]